MNKRAYNKLTIDCLRVETACGILVGSLTATPIQVADVTVKDFDAGFNEGGKDFKDISFD